LVKKVCWFYVEFLREILSARNLPDKKYHSGSDLDWSKAIDKNKRRNIFVDIL